MHMVVSRTFLAVYMCMRIVWYPSMRDYGQKDPIGLYGQALASWMMAHCQFSDFYKCVAFEWPEKVPDPNWPGKFCYVDQPWFMEELAKNFADWWYVSEELLLDEALAKYAGMAYMTVFQRNKPGKNGLEVWKGSSCSTYCFFFVVNMDQPWTKVHHSTATVNFARGHARLFYSTLMLAMEVRSWQLLCMTVALSSQLLLPKTSLDTYFKAFKQASPRTPPHTL